MHAAAELVCCGRVVVLVSNVMSTAPVRGTCLLDYCTRILALHVTFLLSLVCFVKNLELYYCFQFPLYFFIYSEYDIYILSQITNILVPSDDVRRMYDIVYDTICTYDVPGITLTLLPWYRARAVCPSLRSPVQQ